VKQLVEGVRDEPQKEVKEQTRSMHFMLLWIHTYAAWGFIVPYTIILTCPVLSTIQNMSIITEIYCSGTWC